MNKENTLKSGVYIILNKINGKFYVGSSKKIKQRLSAHKVCLRRNNHHNQYLQKSWNKYGEDNFIFEIVEYCDLDSYLQREQHWIDFHNTTNEEIGYNICPKAATCAGRKLSKTHKQNISNAHKSKYLNMSPEERQLAWIEHSKRLTGIRKLTEEEKIAFVERMKNSKKWFEKPEVLKKRIEQIKKANSKPVIQYSKEGNFIQEYDSAVSAVLFLGLDKSKSGNINAVCRKDKSKKSYLGFVWKFKKDVQC